MTNMMDELRELKKDMTNIKKQVYANKEEIIIIKVENKNFKDDINRLINKLDNFIDLTTSKELTKQEKTSLMFKNIMYGGITTLIIAILIDYIIK